MAPTAILVLRRYHDALNAFDLDAVALMFAEDAEYRSPGIGVLRGRGAIMAAMRSYFAEFDDQRSDDDRVEALGPGAARSHWRLTATSNRTGKPSRRTGVETLHIDPAGLVRLVEVQDT